MMPFILCIIAVVFLIILIKQFTGALKPTREVVKMRSGSVGAGKTVLCSLDILKDYKRLYKRWKHNKKKYKRPVIYSNIPFRINRKKWANVLKREHLLLQELFPDDVIPLVLWDEAGLSCNQYSYDDPNVISQNINDSWQCVEVFIRLYRHFYGDSNDSCRLYVTDQATGDLCIALRRRFGFIDNLSNFRRWLGFTPFYKVDVMRLFMPEDSVQNVNSLQTDESLKDTYYFGFLSYRIFDVRHYNSHAFEPVKLYGFTSQIPFDNWADNTMPDKLTTNYVPDIRLSIEERAKYKASIKSREKIALTGVKIL